MILEAYLGRRRIIHPVPVSTFSPNQFVGPRGSEVVELEKKNVAPSIVVLTRLDVHVPRVLHFSP